MKSFQYSVEIRAPKQKVWHAMLDLETYEQWTNTFQGGSTFKGNWDKGSKIIFVSKEDAGKSGIAGRIVENIPYEYISIETVTLLVDGHEDTTSEESLNWIGSHEDYHFTEKGGVTTVLVELSGQGLNDDIKEMFDGMWPEGLQKLKEIAES